MSDNGLPNRLRQNRPQNGGPRQNRLRQNRPQKDGPLQNMR